LARNFADSSLMVAKKTSPAIAMRLDLETRSRLSRARQLHGAKLARGVAKSSPRGVQFGVRRRRRLRNRGAGEHRGPRHHARQCPASYLHNAIIE
jgi:hypothetical protein